MGNSMTLSPIYPNYFSGGRPTRSDQRAAYSKSEGSFWFAYLTSMASASLGMAKALKIGVCKVLSNKGLLDGLLTSRFILLFITCIIVLAAKALVFVMVLFNHHLLSFKTCTSKNIRS